MIGFTERIIGAFAVGNSLEQRFPSFLVHNTLNVSKNFSWQHKAKNINKKPQLLSGQIQTT